MPDMTPAEELAFDADLLLSAHTTDRERTVAELLNYVAATWDHQTPSLREHAQAVARAHTTPGDGLPPRLRAALDTMARRGPVFELAALPKLVVKDTTARYAVELRLNPGQASCDGHAGWTCDAGASMNVEAVTPGPGRLGTLHGVIYVCPEHRAAAEERITGSGYGPQPEPAPAGARWNPWPCGHVTAYSTQALAALTGQNEDGPHQP
jgi:hypothetical protein